MSMQVQVEGFVANLFTQLCKVQDTLTSIENICSKTRIQNKP